MGDFYDLSGEKPFKTKQQCMTEKYKSDDGQDNMVDISEYTKNHLYFMGKSMVWSVKRSMTKPQLCDVFITANP